MSIKKNVLILHADQLRADCIGPYGNAQVKTPNLDRLAGDSVRFDNHFCPYPVCTPSRYSLLSGLYVHQHLGWSNRCTLPPGIPTFPKLLRENGWKTAAVGKMHFTPSYLDVGFDTMILAEQDGNGRFCDDYHAFLMERGLLDKVDLVDQRPEYRAHAPREYFDSFGVRVSDLPEEHHSTSWITDRALEQIGTWDPEGGNLLMVGYIKPHHPFDPPKQYADLYDPDEIKPLPGYTQSVPSFDYSYGQGYFDNAGLSLDRLRAMTAFYYAAITQIDDGVGKILTQLKAGGHYDDTMILFTSDHGDYLGFHHMALKSNHMYDPLMRIPLLIKYPGQARAGGSVPALSENIDIADEILSVCGLADAPGPGCLTSGREYVVGEYRAGGSCHYMIRSQRYKLLVNGSPDDLALFDLERDPLELSNQAQSPGYADVVRGLMDNLLSVLAFHGVSPVYLDMDAPTAGPVKDPAQADKLRAYMRAKSGVDGPSAD